MLSLSEKKNKIISMTISDFEKILLRVTKYENFYTEKLIKNAFNAFISKFPKTVSVNDLFKWLIIHGPKELQITVTQVDMIRYLITDIVNGCPKDVPIINKSIPLKDEWEITNILSFIDQNSKLFGDHIGPLKNAFSHFELTQQTQNSTTANFIGFLRMHYEPIILNIFLKVLCA